MSDPLPPTQGAQATGTAGLTVPADIQQKFGDLIALIKNSESMNDEERQYWVNILPIMTPEQIKNLRDILESEKRQLADIDHQYAEELGKMGGADLVKQTEEQQKQRRDMRRSKEETHRAEEDQKTDDILKQIQEQ